jgi:hypothetical protein
MLIEIKRTVTAINLTADHWELYDLSGRVSAAKRLNRKLMQAINKSNTAEQAIAEFAPALRAESKFGASDSEGWALAEYTIWKAFGE